MNLQTEDEHSQHTMPFVAEALRVTTEVKPKAEDNIAARSAAMRRQIRKKRRALTQALALQAGSFLFGIVLVGIGDYILEQSRWAFLWRSPKFISMFLLCLLSCAIFSVYGLLSIIFHSFGLFTAYRKKRNIAQSIVKEPDIQSLGILIDSFPIHNPKLQRAALDTLTTLLANLQSTDAHLLTPTHINYLRGFLNVTVDSVFIKDVTALFQPASQDRIAIRVAILQAFAVAGDEKCLSVVQKLANGDTHSDAQRQIKAAAQACLPELMACIEAQRDPRSLLRAASANDNQVDSLLRATNSVTATPPEELLHVSGN